MATGTGTPVSVCDAIAAFEASQTALSNADTSQTAAQQKYDAALSAKNQADADDGIAASNYNNAIDVLVVALNGAKRVLFTGTAL